MKYRGIFLYRLRRLYAGGTLACTGKLAALAQAPEFQRLLYKPHLVATSVDQRRCPACGGVMVRYRLSPDLTSATGSLATAWSISATRAPPGVA